MKREQSRAGSRFAECEKSRLKAKIMITLALLLTVATSAWAQSLQSFNDLIEEIGSGGNITLQYDYYKYESGSTIEISTSGVIDGNGAIIDMEGANISHVFYISANNVTIKNLSIINYTGTGDAIYFSGSGGSVYNIGYDVALNRVTTANTWTLSMPSGNVLLTPQYATVAKWAVESAGTTDEKTLLPAAAEGVIAGTDASLIAEGTGIVAFAGTSTEVTQGTVMYAVTAATATEAPALTSSDWKNTVPTAKTIADDGAEVKVWYYIQGADTPDGEDATLDNTFNNSDICATPLTVTVLSNKFDLTLNAANANTIDATQASKGTVSVKVGTAAAVDKTGDITDEGKLEAIKMGSEVKLNAKQGYKFRKVQVKNAGPGPLTYATKEGAVTRIKFYTGSDELYADFTYSNGSFTRTGGSGNYGFSGSWTMKEENGVLTMTANYNEMNTQFLYFVCTFYVDTNEYTVSNTGSWNYSFRGIEVNGNDITDQLTKVK